MVPAIERPFGPGNPSDLVRYGNEKNTDLKDAIVVYTSNFGEKVDLASLKSKIDKLDIDNLQITPVDWRMLGDAGKMKLFKRLYMMN